MSEINWQDPPPDGRGRAGRAKKGKHFEIAAALRENPGRWALVWEGSNEAVSGGVRAGAGSWAPKGAYKVAMRKRPDGLIDHYVRYVGTTPVYRTVWRCAYDGYDPAGCSWSTTRYSEIDAHENQHDVGHFVVGYTERET